MFLPLHTRLNNRNRNEYDTQEDERNGRGDPGPFDTHEGLVAPGCAVGQTEAVVAVVEGGVGVVCLADPDEGRGEGC